MLQRLRSSGHIEPCLPSPADQPPTGTGWIHEIRHDGFRLMARRDPVGIRLLNQRFRSKLGTPRSPLRDRYKLNQDASGAYCPTSLMANSKSGTLPA
jgi:hypothetical protein